MDGENPAEIMSRKEMGKALADLRERKTSLSRRQIAVAIKSNRQKVNEIEKGMKYPDVDELFRWLQLCGKTFGDFFNEPNPHNPYARQFKTHHDDLEYVLSKVGPDRSTAIATLKQECMLLQMRDAAPRDQPAPEQLAKTADRALIEDRPARTKTKEERANTASLEKKKAVKPAS